VYVTGDASASISGGALVETTASGSTGPRGAFVSTQQTFQPFGNYQLDVDWTPGASPSANFQQVPALYFFDAASNFDGSYAEPTNRHIRVELASSGDNASRTHVRVVARNSGGNDYVIKDNALSPVIAVGSTYHITAVLNASANQLTLTVTRGATTYVSNAALDLTDGGIVNPIGSIGNIQVGLFSGGQYYTDSLHDEQWANFVLQGPPQLYRLSASSVVQGQSLTLFGQAFGSSQGSGSVSLAGGTPLAVTFWSDSQITVTVPSDAPLGANEVTVVNSLGLSTRSMYLWIDRVIDPLISDGFTTALNTSVWGTNLTGNASATAGGGELTEVTASGSTGPRGALVYSLSSFNNDGLYQLNADWTPSSVPSANFQVVPAIYFYDASAATDSSYAEPTNRLVRVELGASNDNPLRTLIRVVSRDATSGDQVIASVTPVPFTTGHTHHVHAALDLTNKVISVDIDGTLIVSSASLTLGGTINPLGAIAYMRLGLFSGGQYYTDASHQEQFTNVVLQGPPQLSRLSRSSTAQGGSLTLYGSGFGATQGSGSVNLANGAALNATSWSDSQVTATVPSGVPLGATTLSITASNGLIAHPVYLWVDSFIDPVLTETFTSALNTAIWGTNLTGNATATAGGGYLTEVTASGSTGPRGALVYNQAPFNSIGLYHLNVNWIPSSVPSANFQQNPAIYFFDATANRDSSYAEPTNRFVRVELAASNDNPVRTQLRVVSRDATSGDQIIQTVTLPVALPTGVVHQLHAAMDFNNKVISVDIDGTLLISSTSLTADQGHNPINPLGSMYNVQLGLFGGGQYYVDAVHQEQWGTLELDGGTPQLVRLSRSSLVQGGSLSIYGSGFGASQGSGSVSLGSGQTLGVTSWSDSTITATVPASAPTGANSLSVMASNSLVSRSVYVWIDPAVASLISDPFTSSLNAAVWGTYITGNATAVSGGGSLTENTASGSTGPRGALVYSQTQFNKLGLYHLNVNWTPSASPSANFQDLPALYFFDLTATRDGSYADPTSRHVRVELGNAGDGAQRTHIRIVSRTGSSGDQVIRDQALAVPLETGYLHQLHAALDTIHQTISVDVDGALLISSVSLTTDQNSNPINPLGAMGGVALGLYGGGQYYVDAAHQEQWSSLTFEGPVQLNRLSKASVAESGTVSIYGQGFGASQGAGSITLTNGSSVNLSPTSWSDSTITATVPANAPTGGGQLSVTNGSGLVSRSADLWVDTTEGSLLFDNFSTPPLNPAVWAIYATGSASANDNSGYLLENTASGSTGDRGVTVYTQSAYSKSGLYHLNVDWVPGPSPNGFNGYVPAAVFFDTSSAKDTTHGLPAEKYVKIALGATGDAASRSVIQILTRGAGAGSTEYVIRSLTLPAPLTLQRHQLHAQLDFTNDIISLDVDGNSLVANASLLADQNSNPINTIGAINNFQTGFYSGDEYNADSAHQEVLDDFSFDVFSSSKPTAQVLFPTNNSVVGGTVTVSGTATDTTGVTQDEFFIDGVGQGINNPPVYSFAWNTKALNGQSQPLYPDGSHSIYLQAWNTANNTGDSAAVNVTVQNTPPVITLATPPVVVAPNESTATFSWTTNDIATSQVAYGLAPGVYTSTFPATVSTTTLSSLGTSHSVQVAGLTPLRRYYYRDLSYDQVGNFAQSAERSFITESTPPTLVITYPLSGSATNQTVVLAYTVTDAFSVSSNIVVTDNYGTFTFANTGSYNAVVNAVNEAGVSTSTRVNFIVDKQGPNPITNLSVAQAPNRSAQLSWNAPSDNFVTVSSYTIVYLANTPLNSSNYGSAVVVSSNVPAQSPGAAENYTVTGLNLSQVYYFGIVSTNSLGNASSLSNVAVLSVQPPSVTIAAPAAGATLARPTTVSGTATDNYDVTQVVMSLNGVALATSTFNSNSVGYSFILNTADPRVSNGTQETLTITATDASNNVASSSIPVNIQYAPPAAPVLTGPVNGSSTTATVNVTGAAEPGITVQLYVNGAPTALQTQASGSGAFNFYNVTVPLTGSNAISAAAFDAKGTSPMSNVISVFLDVGAPNPPVQMTADSLPAGQISLSWSAPASGEPPASYRVYRATSTTLLVAGNLSTATYRIASGLTQTSYTDLPPADGIYAYAVTGVDNVGNEGPLSAPASATSDRQTPTGAIALSSAPPLGPGSYNLTLTVTQAPQSPPLLTFTPAGGAPNPIFLTADPVLVTVWHGVLSVTAQTPTGLGLFALQVRDLVGNVGTAITSGGSVTLVTTGPVGTVILDHASPIKAATVNASLTLSEPAASTPTLSFTPFGRGAVAIALTGSGASWSGSFAISTNTGDGLALLSYSATDAYGNVGTTLTGGTTSFLIKTTPPGAPQFLTTLSQAAGVVLLRWSAPPDGAPASYNVYRGGALIHSGVLPAGDGSGSYSDLPASDGTYNYSVSAVDAAGNEGAQTSAVPGVSIRTPPAAPISLTASITASNQISLTWQAGSTETLSGYNVYRATAAFASTAGLTPRSATTPPFLDTIGSNATYYYAVTALDVAGNESALSNEAAIYYNRAPPAIVVAGVTNGEYSNVNVTITFSSPDPALTSLTATLDGQPFASGSTVSAVGQHELAVNAVNSGGFTGQKTVSFTIDKTPPVVTISGVLNGATYYASVAPTVTASDLNLNTTSFLLNGAPFVSGSTIAAAGSYTLTASATDLAGNSATQSVSFSVVVAPQQPQSLAAVVQDSLVSLSWQDSDARAVGYRVYKNGALVSGSLQTAVSFQDSAFTAGAAAGYDVTSLDSIGQESARAHITIPAVTMSLPNYGASVSGQSTLTRGFFDTIPLSVANLGPASAAFGPATLTLTSTATAPGVSLAPAATLSAGQTAAVSGAVFTSAAAPNAMTLAVALTLPTEPGTTAVYQKSFTVNVGNPQLPIVEIFTDPLILGTKSNVHVEFHNRGSAPADIVTALFPNSQAQPSPAVTASLYTSGGFLLSQGGVQQTDNGASSFYSGATGQIDFVSVPAGGTFLFDPIGVYVPPSLSSNAVVTATISTITFSTPSNPIVETAGFTASIQTNGISQPPYTVSIRSDRSVYDQQATVTLSGTAVNASSAPVPGVPVTLGIVSGGFQTTIATGTDVNGNYLATYNPGLAVGVFNLWAAYPAIVTPNAQSSFSVVGLQLQYSNVVVNTVQGTTFTFTVNLNNVGANAETGFTTQITNLGTPTSAVQVALDTTSLPTTLTAGSQATLRFLIYAAPNAPSSAQYLFALRDSYGFSRTINPIQINITPPQVIPQVTPQTFAIGMLAGTTRSQSFTVSNIGSSIWQGVTVSAPALPWATLAAGNSLGNIVPGQSANFTINFAPPASLVNGNYNNNNNPLVQILSGNASPVSVYGGVTITSVLQGGLTFHSIDADQPLNAQTGAGVGVAGTSVTLTSNDISGLSFTAYGDANGTAVFNNIPAGNYTWVISANGFNQASGNQVVEAGINQTVQQVLTHAYVTYTWVVTPTLIADEYNVTLNLSFLTDVPAPVVTITPAAVNLSMTSGQTAYTQLTVTNHGLVAADNFSLDINNTDPAVSISLPYTTIPTLAAQQTVVIPVQITLAHASCHNFSVGGHYEYKCVAGVLTKVFVPGSGFGIGDCGGTAPSGGGGLPGPAGGGGGFGFGGIGGAQVQKLTGTPPPTPPQKCGRELVITTPKKPQKPSCGSGDPVDLVDGNNTMTENDLDVYVPELQGQPFTFTRYYNSQDLGSASLGKSWHHSFEWALLPLGALAYVYQDPLDGMWYKYGSNISNDSVGIITPMGQHIQFNNNGGGTYTEATFVEGSNVVKNSDGSYTWNRPQSDVVYRFDSTGRLTAMVDDNGNAATLSYGGNGLLSTVKDPSGRTIYTLSYDANGHLSSLQDVGNRTVGYQVTNGELTQVNGPAGTTSYGYNGYLLTSKTSPTGLTMTWSYSNAKSNSSLGTPFLYASADGCTVVGASMMAGGAGDGFSCMADVNQAAYQEWYGTSGPILQQSTSCVKITEFSAGVAAGDAGASAGFTCGVQVVSGGSEMIVGSAGTPPNSNDESSLDGDVLTLSNQGFSQGFTANYYYEVGRTTQAVLTQDNAGYNATWLRSNSNGVSQITGVIDQVGDNYSDLFDANGFTTAATAPDGSVQKYSYDSAERIVSGVTPRGYPYSYAWHSTLYRFASATDPNGNATQWSYDPNGNPLGQTNALGVTDWTFAYDGQGRVTSVADAYGDTVRYQYDSYGHWTSGADALGRATSYAYDPLGRPVSMTNAKGKTYSFTYDVNGYLTSATDPLGHGDQLTRRLSDGRITQDVDPNGNATNMAWDNEGKLTSVANALNQTKTFSYDVRGHVSRVVNPNGANIPFSYDGDGRVILAQFPDDTLTIGYNDVQRTETDSDNNATIVKTYDADHNLVSVAETDKLDGTVFTINYTYDANDNRTGMATPFGNYSYTYDALNRMTTLTDYKNQQYRFSYDQDSRLTAVTFPSGLVESYSYDAASQVTGMSASAGGNQVLTRAYGYDALRRLTSVTWPTGSRAFSYDDASRLVSVTNPGSTLLPYANESYSYDPGDNLTSSPVSPSSTYGKANRLLSDAQWTYSYDADGNLVTKTSQTSNDQIQYAYDSQDRLVSVQDSASGRLTTYRYDMYDRRLTKTITLGAISEVWRYWYDGDSVISLSIKDVNASGDATTNVFYFTQELPVDQPLAIHGAADYFYLQDPSGSIVGMTDINGTLQERVEYTGYGIPVFVSAVDGSTAPVSHLMGNPYAFAGREWDGDTNLYFVRMRYYDPALGRFVQKDPETILDDYQYALSNPTNFTDPYGLQPNPNTTVTNLNNQVNSITLARSQHDSNDLAAQEHLTRAKMNTYTIGTPATVAAAALWETWTLAMSGIGAATAFVAPCSYGSISKNIKKAYTADTSNPVLIFGQSIIFSTAGQAFPPDPANRDTQKYIEIMSDAKGIQEGWSENPNPWYKKLIPYNW